MLLLLKLLLADAVLVALVLVPLLPVLRAGQVLKG